MASKKNGNKPADEVSTPAVPAAKAVAPRPRSAVRGVAEVIQGRLLIDPTTGFISIAVGEGDNIALKDFDKPATLQLILELTDEVPTATLYEDSSVLDDLKTFLADYAKAGIFGSVTTGRPPPPPPPKPAAPPPLSPTTPKTPKTPKR